MSDKRKPLKKKKDHGKSPEVASTTAKLTPAAPAPRPK